MSVIAMGDYCDNKSSYLLKVMDFSTSAGEVEKFVSGCQATTGGDGPEAYEYALEQARLKLSWTAGSNRTIVVIGDALPHSATIAKAQQQQHGVENPREINWREEADSLYKQGTKIVAVQALNQALSTNFYKSLAARTCGTYVQLSEFGAVVDMLMAICFREVSQEKFEGFVAEVEQEGRMDSGRRKMFRQISKEITPRGGRGASKTMERTKSKEKVTTETPAETTTTTRSSSKGISRSKSKEKITSETPAETTTTTTTAVPTEAELVPEKEKQMEKSSSKTMSRSKSKGSKAT